LFQKADPFCKAQHNADMDYALKLYQQCRKGSEVHLSLLVMLSLRIFLTALLQFCGTSESSSLYVSAKTPDWKYCLYFFVQQIGIEATYINQIVKVLLKVFFSHFPVMW
jgi:hypothetical protein